MFLWIGLFGLVILGFVIQIVYEQYRHGVMKKIAHGLGFQYAQNPSFKSAKRFQKFDLMKSGRVGKVRRGMNGKVGDVDVSVFDYRHVIGDGQERLQTVLAMDIPEAKLPRFTLRPKGMTEKLLDFADEEPFPRYPELSDTFDVHTGDPNEISRILTHDAVEFLLDQPRLTVEASGTMLLFYRKSSQKGRKQLPDFITQSVECGLALADGSA